MSDRSRPTIRDVARAAGVSIGTVSNVLTGARPVALATRQAIEAAIDELGYAPDQAGRVLNSRRRRHPQAPPPGMPRLTTLGYLCADLTARVAVLPGRDERVAARLIEKTLGGAAANVAAVAAGIGGPFTVWTELMSVLGTDPESDWATGLLGSRGVTLTEGSRRQGAHLSRCIILVDAVGSRTIINEPLQVPPNDLLRWLGRQAAPQGRHCLHIQGDQLEGVMDALPAARARGLTLACHAPGLPPRLCSPEGLRLIVSLFDLVFLDSRAARTITGANTDLVAGFHRLLEPRRRATVVLTRGAEGAALFEPGSGPRLIPAEPVTPVDRTGAGDCFAGTYLAVWLSGRPAIEACRLAVKAARRSVLAPGAQEYRPEAAELLDTADAEVI
ncbi:carbohydrate kinase family protein [Geminicoccus roseus]|uniref:carbohydrate kinase family protein n=1 Tax=Geminicoccus roseus TaxID=404900 RepID=UPI0004231B34|nr:PfkB family carbohydrate kinase [Geminicoccus roseus]